MEEVPGGGKQQEGERAGERGSQRRETAGGGEKGWGREWVREVAGGGQEQEGREWEREEVGGGRDWKGAKYISICCY